MTDLSRALLRLKLRALQGYELLLYAMLLALAAGVALPASADDAQDAPVHCGNIQSSTVVIAR